MKKFICPVDFTETANNAVEYASKLAQYSGASITLFHAIDELSMKDASRSDSAGSNVRDKEQSIREKLEEFCAAVEDSFSVSCEPLITTYSAGVESVIKKELEEHQYDLVVMGTRGADSLEEFFLGTHTYKVIRKTSSPLLLIPQGCVFKEPKQVVYASNYKTEDPGILRRVIDLLEEFDPELTVLHISKKQSEKNDEIFSFFEDLYRDKLKGREISFHHLTDENIARALDDYMISSKSDFLVLFTHHYSLVEKIFHDSVTKKMSLIASYPILIDKAG